MSNHFLGERTITDKLIESTETTIILDKISTSQTISDESATAILGWESVAPSPKYVVRSSGQGKRRRLGDTLTVRDDNKAAVRCVGDDFDDHQVASWKANVEKGTYRYIPNNGCYRTLKFMDENRSDYEWYTVNKKQPEKVSITWQHKRMQRELKRQIKNDLHQNSGNVKERGKLKDVEEDVADTGTRPSTDPNRVQSAHSDIINSNNHLWRLEENHTRDLYKDGLQSRDHFTKSLSDLFVASLSSRMNVLDEELKRDSKLIRKSQDETGKVSMKQKNKEKNKENNTQTRQYRKETLGQEVFTIRAVGTRENTNRSDLRPLEKITPQQRIAEDVHKLSIAQLKYNHRIGDGATNPVGSHHMSTSAPDFEKTLNSYQSATEGPKHSLWNTLPGSKITPGKGRVHGLAPATAVTICDELNSSTLGAGDGCSIPSHSSQQPHEVIQNGHVGAVLPQISGKRLEVVTSSHRWL